ncbi:MAG: DUF4233 domain-containing protein [Micrococcaceae bacterium]
MMQEISVPMQRQNIEQQPAVKKKRSTQAMFTSTVLCLEAFVVLFAMLAMAGLSDYSKAIVFTVGLVLSAALIGTCAFIRKPQGIIAGWILQGFLILGGFFINEMFFIGILFAIAWWYAVTKGKEIDVEVAQRQAEERAYFENLQQGEQQ